jgi:fructose-bisphosphate aldolase class II
MNIDTDLQFAFTEGIVIIWLKTLTIWKLKSDRRFWFQTKNITKWMRESEMTFNARLEQAFADLNNVNTL